MPLEIRDEWLVAVGKAASFLRHRASDHYNPMVAEEYRSVAATLTDMETLLIAQAPSRRLAWRGGTADREGGA